MHSSILLDTSKATQFLHLDCLATSTDVFQCFAALSQYSSSFKLRGPYWI